MIQFIKIAVIDPEGFALVKLDDISSIGPGPVRDEIEHCIIVTRADRYIAIGSINFFTEVLRGLIGSEYDALPEAEQLNE